MERLLCGVDIGGTKLAAGLVKRDGTLVRTVTTNEHTCLDEVCLMDLVADMVNGLCREQGIAVSDLEGVGVGMAGHMRSRDGVVITTSNLDGFKNYPLAKELNDRLGVRVILENDANCQAWAEHLFGAGRGFGDMVFVTVSTGIGAGLIINNRLYRGQTGTAGEIGHTIVDPTSDIGCTCGNNGCFMALASTLNLDQIVRRKSVRFTNTHILDNLDEDGDNTKIMTRENSGATTRKVDGRHVYGYAKTGDPVALEIMHEYADYLGIMVYNIFQIFNPPVIVLGGGLMNWEMGFFERLRSKFDSLAGHMLFDPIKIVKAEIKESSGVMGAATLL